MPRRFSSASRSGSIPVSAVMRVDLPWSMWPAVPITLPTVVGRSGGGVKSASTSDALGRRLHRVDQDLVLAFEHGARVDAARAVLDASDHGRLAVSQRCRKP